MKRSIGRQNRLPGKARYNMKWDPRNYDYLLQRSREEGKSVATLVNEIVRAARQNVPPGTLETS